MHMSLTKYYFCKNTHLNDISVRPKRQTLMFPSAVILRRLQVPQKLSVIEVMNPIWPLNPGTL